MPILVVFTGLSGTGKSTLSERVGRQLGAPVFATDWLLGALKPAAAVLAGLDRETMGRLHTGLLRMLILRQLQLGQSAVLDTLVSAEVLLDWRHLADEHGVATVIVECVCSDVQVHRGRVQGRVRGIPGWHEIDWEHVETMRSMYPRLTLDCLVVDAVDSVADNERLVLDAVGADPSAALPPGPVLGQPVADDVGGDERAGVGIPQQDGSRPEQPGQRGQLGR